MILAAVAEAQEADVRLAKACALIGISAHTVERWRRALAAKMRAVGSKCH